MPIEFIHYYFDFHVFRSFLGLLFVYSHRPYIEQTRVAFFCDDSNRIEHKKKFAHSKNERCFVRTYTHTHVCKISSNFLSKQTCLKKTGLMVEKNTCREIAHFRQAFTRQMWSVLMLLSILCYTTLRTLRHYRASSGFFIIGYLKIDSQPFVLYL